MRNLLHKWINILSVSFNEYNCVKLLLLSIPSLKLLFIFIKKSKFFKPYNNVSFYSDGTQDLKILKNNLTKNLLEQIICDADLDYLGREGYEENSLLLLQELRLKKEISALDWLKIHI